MAIRRTPAPRSNPPRSNPPRRPAAATTSKEAARPQFASRRRSAPAPAPSEVEEQEEEAGEEQEYQEEQPEQRETARYSRPQQSAPQRQIGGAPSATGSGNSGSVRITGLFAGRKPGLYSGKLRDEDVSKLRQLLDDAEAQGQPVVLFLWENQGSPEFSLTGSISAPKPGGISRQRGGSYR